MKAKTRLLFAVAAVAALWGCLTGCLLQQPLVRPDDTYDARAALRGDSLDRFDTVEVWIEDAGDSGNGTLLWKGHWTSSDSLGAGVAAGDREVVFVVHGFKRDRGYCYVERKSRDGDLLHAEDSCVKEIITPPTPKDSVPPKDTLPRFAEDTLSLSDSLPAYTRIIRNGASAIRLRATEDWIETDGTVPDAAGSDTDYKVQVSPRADGLEAGPHWGLLILESGGKAVDSLVVGMTVMPRYLFGKVVDWGAGKPQPGILVDVGTGNRGVTGEEGVYSIGFNGKLPSVIFARFSAPGRIGKLDTLRRLPGAPPLFVTTLPPAASFRAVNLPSASPIGAVAAAAGYAIVLSDPLNQQSSVSLVRLDVQPPVFEKAFDLANSDGDPDFPEYFEPGEIAADSDALYIAYPNDNRIGRVEGWRGSPSVISVSVPLQPGGLLRDGGRLLTLGRLDDGTLALARFRASDLTHLEIDTLSGYVWDGVLATHRSPKLVSGPDGYYAVDGNQPNVKGHLLRIGKEDGKVQAVRELSEGEVDDLTWIGDVLYVSGSSQGSHWLRGFHADLTPADSIATGTSIDRLASDGSGRFGSYGFATAADNDTVMAFAPSSREPLGRLPLPGERPARSIALDPASRTVLVSDGSTLFSASF